MNLNKFQEIYLDIKTKITDGEYKEGDLVESEHDLASTYSVTRETVRKALSLLQTENYIEKKQGIGSIVKNKQYYKKKELLTTEEIDYLKQLNDPILNNIIEKLKNN